MGLLAGGAVAAAVGAAGCAIPAATAASAGLAVAEAGAGAFQRGEIRAALRAPFPAVETAAHTALDELGFDTLEDRTNRGDGRLYLVAQDDRGRRLSIRLQSRTEVVTKLRIRVGAIPDRTVAGLILAELLKDLPEDAIPSAGV